MKNLVHFLLFLCLSLPLHGKTRVACIGNSITYGMGTDNPATDSYPAQLGRLLGDNYEVGNFGKSRSTLLSKGHFPYFDQEEWKKALEFEADVAIIHLGVNDTDPRNWPNYGDDFVSEYCGLIDSLRLRNPDCRIIIAKLSPLTARHHRFKSGTRDWRIAINAAIENVARATGAELIDFGEPLRDRQNLIPDAVHPNTEGASLLARTAYSAITGDYGGLQLPEIYGNGWLCNATPR